MKFSKIFPPEIVLVDDNRISFNIRKKPEKANPFPRRVAHFPEFYPESNLVPGVKPSSETALYRELRRRGDDKSLEKGSFTITPCLHAFSWRFRVHPPEKGLLRNPEPMEDKDAREAARALRAFSDRMREYLRPGMVYLMPDERVPFRAPFRKKKPYARAVLVAFVRPGLVRLVPFSTKIKWMNWSWDVLFDQNYKGETLDPKRRPTIEIFPYKLFDGTYLSVYTPWNMKTEEFLGAVVAVKSAVRKELVDFVLKRI